MLALLLSGALVLPSCGSRNDARAPEPGETVRYRLLLRENPENPGEAYRCYGRCQSARSPAEYIECLSSCPAFERTFNERCESWEVPPVAACLVARRIDANKEPPPGYVVLTVLGSVALIVTAASLCTLSNSQCGYPLPPPQ